MVGDLKVIVIDRSHRSEKSDISFYHKHVIYIVTCKSIPTCAKTNELSWSQRNLKFLPTSHYFKAWYHKITETFPIRQIKEDLTKILGPIFSKLESGSKNLRPKEKKNEVLVIQLYCTYETKHSPALMKKLQENRHTKDGVTLIRVKDNGVA